MSSVTRMYGSFLVHAPRNCGVGRDGSSMRVRRMQLCEAACRAPPGCARPGAVRAGQEDGRRGGAARLVELRRREHGAHATSGQPAASWPRAPPHLHGVGVVHAAQDLDLAPEVAQRNLGGAFEDLGGHQGAVPAGGAMRTRCDWWRARRGGQGARPEGRAGTRAARGGRGSAVALHPELPGRRARAAGALTTWRGAPRQTRPRPASP